jgi:hypothetical protein
LIFVFDPLAIALVISTNQAFKKKEPYIIIDNEDNNVEPEIIERIVEIPVEVERIVEVEKIVEVPVDRIIEVPVDRVVEIERRIEVPYEVEKLVEVPVKYYVKEDGTVTDEDGNIISEPEKLRVLKYTK